eukprot:4545126-Alexandrium_andersonii.AAC.1
MSVGLCDPESVRGWLRLLDGLHHPLRHPPPYEVLPVRGIVASTDHQRRSETLVGAIPDVRCP